MVISSPYADDGIVAGLLPMLAEIYPPFLSPSKGKSKSTESRITSSKKCKRLFFGDSFYSAFAVNPLDISCAKGASQGNPTADACGWALG